MPGPYQGPDSDLAPNSAVAKEFLSWWFERVTRGVLEIGWTDTKTGGLTNFEQFALDDVDSLLATAVQANLVPGQAMYFRAATVMSWGNGPHRTSDMDFEQAPGAWSDIDSPEDFERAKTVQSFIRPNASVITGTIPSVRVQSWFRVDDPIVSGELVKSLNSRIHKLYGGDPSVVNPSRLMRLPGMIAWPRKAGRIPEIVSFVRPPAGDSRPSSYPVSTLTSQLPASETTVGQIAPHVNGAALPAAFGLSGGLTTVSSLIAAIKAGREWHNHMIQLVAHWVGNGRSSTEIMGHCEGWTMPGYTHEQTRREVAKAIDGARQKWRTPDVDQAIQDATVKRATILSLADLDALPPPTWLVHGLVPERSLVVPYGPPKAGKTFVILSLGLHIAAGVPWFGHPVQQGAVVYIAGEGVGGLSLRIKAMRTRYAIAMDVPFWVIPRAVNFRVAAEVNALEAVIRETIGTVRLQLLVVDTLARAMPGADENSVQEMGMVIAAADYLKEELGCTVALVHHEGKDSERGARGTSALRGAWDAAYQITGSGPRVKLTVADQKEAESGQVLSFIMETVQVGIGRSSLVPVLDEAPEPEVEEGRREVGGHSGMMLGVLRTLMAGPESAILPPFSGLPSGDIRGVSVEVWRRGIYEKMPGVEAAARRQAFHRGCQILMQRNLINIKDPWVWLC